MVSSKTIEAETLPQENSSINNKRENKFLYPVLIFIVWLLNYLFYTFSWEHKLGWDEVSYLTTARGIAENWDFSSRTTSIMGLLKYTFPQHNHHYPVYSIYIALFFKIFGVSLQVAYFSTWLCALATSFFVYLTLLLFTGNNKLFPFLVSTSFLFFPRIPDYCDSAMMEIPGCALISVLTFFIFKGLSGGKLNALLIGIAAVWLYFFKSLFIGTIFGFVALIIFAQSKRLSGLKIKSKMPLWGNLISYFLIVGFLYFIFTKFIFLPLAPMMNFHPRLEAPYGPYADFAGGFFNDICGNLKINLEVYYNNVISKFLSLNTIFYPGTDGMYVLIPSWFELRTYLLTYFYVFVFSLFTWRRLLPIQRAFIAFSLSSILAFNVIFPCIAGGGYGLICRYNLIYVPLLLISFGIVLWENRGYFELFLIKHKKFAWFLFASFVLLGYLPFYHSANVVTQWDKNLYRNIAHKNSEIVRKFIQDTKPMFVYFTVGTHTTWDSYPVRVIQFEATNEQIKMINMKLPKPIEYLFLRPENNLFKENQALIVNAQSIIDNSYVFHGFDQENKVVVYKHM